MSEFKILSKWIALNLESFLKISTEIAEQLPTQGIVLFKAPMAAGKTTMINQIVRSLHRKSEAASPTYALHRRYSGVPVIEHWDLYRVNNEEELETSGFWDQFSGQFDLIFIEWPERIKWEWLPVGVPLLIVEIFVNQSNREIHFTKRP